MSDIFGTMAAILSLTCVMVGLPNQIFKNYKHQSCRGLSFWFVFIAFFHILRGSGTAFPNQMPFYVFPRFPCHFLCW